MASLSDLARLLKERSLKMGEFTLSSGKISNYYIDGRKTTMSAEGLELIGALGLAKIRDVGWSPASVGGPTLGADPVAYALARASRGSPPEVNAFTVRKTPKDHGAGGLIEGCFESGDSVVVVEDVLTTGGSALRAANSVREAGGKVLGVFGVVDRLEGAGPAIEEAGLPFNYLLTIEDLGVSIG